MTGPKRLVPALTALALVGATLVLLEQAPASAATYAARLVRPPIAGEVAHISGTIKPAGRPIGLQRYVRGHWVKVATSRTGRGGHYTFGVRTSSATYDYRSYAPRSHGRGAARSNVVAVAPVTPRLSLSVSGAPVGQSRSGTRDLTPATAVFRPARPGTPVGVQALVNGAWTRVAGARQNSRGVAYVQVPAGTPTAPATLRAYSRPTGTSYAYSGGTVPSHQASVWGDEFDGTSLDTSKWGYRLQPAFGKRLCSTPGNASDGLVREGGGQLSLRIKRIHTATSKCPYGVFKNSMIDSTGASGFNGKYGVYAARVKFQTGRGMHGSFWLQGPPVSGAEIDTAEYFGDGRIDSGLSSFVHYTDRRGRLITSGGIRSIGGILGRGHRPSNGWHVYSVEWTPTRYVFRLDGTATLVTSRPHVANVPETMILSLLSSDYELPHLRSTAPAMSVDWVRVWQ